MKIEITMAPGSDTNVARRIFDGGVTDTDVARVVIVTLDADDDPDDVMGHWVDDRDGLPIDRAMVRGRVTARYES